MVNFLWRLIGSANIGEKLRLLCWYILTNLSEIEDVIKVYQARFGIEALFKDCKTGGYNLEGSKASIERLTRLVLLIAIAYTCACLKGDKARRSGQQKYVCRLQELKRTPRRHSNFWIGLYGQMWIIGWEFCRDWIEQLMQLSRNKLPYFQRGFRAMEEIQAVRRVSVFISSYIYHQI